MAEPSLWDVKTVKPLNKMANNHANVENVMDDICFD